MKETTMNDTECTLQLPERALFAELTSRGRSLDDALDDWLAANPDDEALLHVYGWRESNTREDV